MSISPDFAATYLSGLIAGFSHLYPDVLLRLDLSPRRVDILGEGFDLAIRIGAPAEPWLVARKLFLARQGLFAAPEFLRTSPTPTMPSDLAELACVLVGEGEGGEVWTLRRGGEIAEVSVWGRIRANNPRLVLLLSVEGAGIAVGDARMAAPFVETGRLVRVIADWEVAPIPVYAVSASRDLPIRARLFLDHLSAGLRSDGSE